MLRFSRLALISSVVLAGIGLATFSTMLLLAQEAVPPGAKPATAKNPAKNPAKNATKNAGKNPAKRAKAKRAVDPSVGKVLGDNRATPVSRIKVAKGFQVELLYSVPIGQEGSWVNLCLDNKGRILASDQYGGLYRFAAPPPGKPLDPHTIEPVPAPIRAVNGMAWAFDALYVGVNDYEKKIPSGLYRLTDSDGDDQLDKVEMLREMDARGDHGIHAIVPTPDGQALYLITGDSTKPTEYSSTRVPPFWGEDHLLPRMPDGRGFMRDTLGPGGIIYRVSPDGKQFEVVSSGYRNIFDASLNRAGDLFTYDADMEYDFNTSWYRPTRVCQAFSGSEYGWRNGAGKWPEWYPDSVPAVHNIGPGSPTGTTFGYGAKFPAKYQNALFVLDWSWGKMYAVHLKPAGATYSAEREEFLSGVPLPLTDAIINPADGAMYFAIGGRKVQSGLYRVTYVGPESTAAVEQEPVVTAETALRQKLDAFHGKHDPRAIEVAWPELDHADRIVRSSARVAIEHQPVQEWSAKALAETDPGKQVAALLALARATGVDPAHRPSGDFQVDAAMRAKLLSALERIDPNQLSVDEQITWVRTIEIVLNRFGRPDDATVQRLLAKLDPLFPNPSREMNWLLCETLVYLQSEQIAAKAVALLETAPTQEEQIEYARSLRMLKAGWTPETHEKYFRWFLKAASYRGGASFDKFIEFIRNDAIASLSDDQKSQLAPVLAEKPVRVSALDGLSTLFAGREKRDWKLDELAAIAQGGLKHRNFEHGRRMFGAATCFACHRFGNEGGMTGPDLTSAGRRYSPKDLLDQVLNPNKEINEQFVSMVIVTEDDEVYRGVIVNLNGDTVTINTDTADPNQRETIDRKRVVSVEPSKTSLMPAGLLGVMQQDEILDLLAYVLSGGDPQHEFFQPAKTAAK